MKKIAIISSSVREGRMSHRAALFMDRFIKENSLADSHILDLKEYGFPLFPERRGKMKEPPARLEEFVRGVVEADGIAIVSPVYNGSFPAALKNVIDLLYVEWKHKPVAVYSCTAGGVPGIATVQQIQTIMLKLGALVAPALGTFASLATEFSPDGTPTNPERLIPLARPALDELLWLMEIGGQ